MAVWQQIRETLIEEIDKGVLAPGARLPPDQDLASLFGVNRHTVRRALSHLQSEGLLRSERGKGTFVVDDVISFRMAERTYFEEHLQRENKVANRTILSVAEVFASETVGKALQIEPGAPTLYVKSLGEVEEIPVYSVQMYFPSGRLPGIVKAFRTIDGKPSDRISTTAMLRKVGMKNTKRRDARIRTRLPTAPEAQELRMSRNEPVFVTETVHVDGKAQPVFLARSCYCGSRIEFVFDF